jgi:hypothetical protein
MFLGSGTDVIFGSKIAYATLEDISFAFIDSVTIPDLPRACHPEIYSNNDVWLPFVGGCPDWCLRHTVDASERILDFVVDLWKDSACESSSMVIMKRKVRPR